MKTILFPGQGAQFKGMGKALFPLYPQLTELASNILGYSIEELCLEDPHNQLRLTQYTQPSLFVVNALGYYRMRDEEGLDANVDFFVGHSLGEYNALLAAGIFDFETGVKLVQKRGALMGAAGGGGMAAVLGVKVDEVRKILMEHQLDVIDLANFNTPTQLVIAGPAKAIEEAERVFSSKDIRCVVLNVSAPFHSRYMIEAQREFSAFLNEFEFNVSKDETIPVIANSTARPYIADRVAETLSRQIASSVLWTETIRYLMGQGEMEYVEIGSGILSKMVDEIETTEAPLNLQEERVAETVDQTLASVSGEDHGAVGDVSPYPETKALPKQIKVDANSHGAAIEAQSHIRRTSAGTLGSDVFRRRYGVKYAYLAGAMYMGISSQELVIRMAKAGLMGVFGSVGLSLSEVERNILSIQERLNGAEAYGMSLVSGFSNSSFEMDTVNLYLKHEVRNIEASAFLRITPAIALFRLAGLERTPAGKVACRNKIIAKVSRPEIAELFMKPVPDSMVQKLLEERKITPEQADIAKHVPVSHDICVEADSGGRTDGGIPTVLLPAMLRLRERKEKEHAYDEPICLGLAGGIGTPEAAATAFMMGADFILTGSINQCTVEAGISDDVKSLLQDINVQDTDYAPASDMFELGAKVQVLKKGVFFPARANKLYSLYTQYESLGEIPDNVRRQLEERYFKQSFEQVWEDVKSQLREQGKQCDIDRAESHSKYKMALVFKWYFDYSTKLALEGVVKNRVDYQIYTGPSLGAFNQWVKGTALEPWTGRHVDEIGEKMMRDTAAYLNNSFERLARA
ncbi:MAG: ACP S-malonyltransferase [Candidatus Thiodiazotropha sp. (ex Dulcina madagascariensis)]|nr:ACP S-malonyltransferase [Candidatus Thiodiazotropha sp. (ex Dulcina madagascariensis)]